MKKRIDILLYYVYIRGHWQQSNALPLIDFIASKNDVEVYVHTFQSDANLAMLKADISSNVTLINYNNNYRRIIQIDKYIFFNKYLIANKIYSKFAKPKIVNSDLVIDLTSALGYYFWSNFIKWETPYYLTLGHSSMCIFNYQNTSYKFSDVFVKKDIDNLIKGLDKKTKRYYLTGMRSNERNLVHPDIANDNNRIDLHMLLNYNQINNEFIPNPKNNLKLIYPHRVVELKNHVQTLNMLEKIYNNGNKNFEFYIMFDFNKKLSSYEKKVIKLIESLNCKDNIMFFKNKNADEFINYLKEFDLLLLNSLREGFATACVSAIVAGIPSLATANNGYTHNLFTKENYGWYENNTNDFYNKLENLIKSPNIAKNTKLNLSKDLNRLDEFKQDWNKTLKKLINLSDPK